MKEGQYDYIIIGAGIIGLATALKLSEQKPTASIAILEKEDGLARHQTGNNSGVLHSGIYYKPGSSKAINCLKGYVLMLEFCRRYDIPFDICGKLIVATSPKQLDIIGKIYDNGIANGIEGLQWYTPSQIEEREPNIKGLKAILVPQTGIVDYKAVTRIMQKILNERGVTFHFNTKVNGIEEKNDLVEVRTGNQLFHAGFIISCAGLYSDKITAMSGLETNCQILPFRGEYYKFKEQYKHLVNHLVYPVPDPDFPFLGVHFTRMINGDLEAGPNAVLAFAREGYTINTVQPGELFESLTYRGFRKLAVKHLRKGLGEMKRSISKRAFIHELRHLMPDLKRDHIVKAGAGVRAQAIDKNGNLLDDFEFARSSRTLHVVNAPSPAATSSLAIGEQIVSQLND